jgi:hypothetical protein
MEAAEAMVRSSPKPIILLGIPLALSVARNHFPIIEKSAFHLQVTAFCDVSSSTVKAGLCDAQPP